MNGKLVLLIKYYEEDSSVKYVWKNITTAYIVVSFVALMFSFSLYR
jgi:hypothetical protein